MNYKPARAPIPTTKGLDAKLSDLIIARTPLIFADTYDDEQFDVELKSAIEEVRKTKFAPDLGDVVEYVPGLGTFSFDRKHSITDDLGNIGKRGDSGNSISTDLGLESFLFGRSYEQNSILVIRGGTAFLEQSPNIVTWLRMIAGNDMLDASLSHVTEQDGDGFPEAKGKFLFVVVVGQNPKIPASLIPYSASFKTSLPEIDNTRRNDGGIPGADTASGYKAGTINNLFWEEVRDIERRTYGTFLFRTPKEGYRYKEEKDWTDGERKAADATLYGFIDKLSPRLAGFSVSEIRLILRYALHGTSQPRRAIEYRIQNAKRDMVERTGFLKLMDGEGNGKSAGSADDQFGGLKNVRNHLEEVAKLSTQDPADLKVLDGFGTKGILLVGMPGCGKSLVAKAAGDILGWPVIQLDIGRLLGKYVGESEANLRFALSIAERAAPCVMWIDELEKAFSGLDSSDGTALRLFGSFLTWMQEKGWKSVYVIATANNLDKIPSEFKRKGRFDEIFSILLPDTKEREEIFKVHLRRIAAAPKWESALRKWRVADSADLMGAASMAAKESSYGGAGEGEDAQRGFSGADIASVVNETAREAMLHAGKIDDESFGKSFRDSLIRRIRAKKGVRPGKGTTQRDVMAAVKQLSPDGKREMDGYEAMVERLKNGGFTPANETR